MRLLLSSLISLLLFATSAQAYDNLYLDPFSNTDWSSQYGFQACAGYSGGRPCISDGTYFGTNTGDVVFAYTTDSISNSISITSTMRTSYGSNYFAIDMMTGPRNDEQGNKTEYVVISITKKNIQGSTLETTTFNENVSNTTMETYAYDIGSLGNVYSIDVTISGKDGGFWAGNYGAVLGANSVYFTDTDPTAVVAPSYSSEPTSLQLQDRTNTRAITGSGIYIQQSGDNLDLDIQQYGDGQLIAGSDSTNTNLVDANISGDYNTVNVKQGHEFGISDDNVLLFDIIGGHNSLTVEQGHTTTDEGGHRAVVDVTGGYNTINLYQYDGGQTGDHFAKITIGGDDNSVTSHQRDNGDKMLFLNITGDDNTLSTNQKNTGEHFLDITLGSDQTVSVTQEGSGNHAATIDMDGYSSTLQLNQNSSTDQTYSIDQTCLNVSGCGTTTVTQN